MQVQFQSSGKQALQVCDPFQTNILKLHDWSLQSLFGIIVMTHSLLFNYLSVNIYVPKNDISLSLISKQNPCRFNICIRVNVFLLV